MLVEAAWVAAKTPGPLRAFFVRVRGRRGHQIAAVATARKLAVLAWHLLTKQQDYAWARPSLTDKKRRALELRAASPPSGVSGDGLTRTTSRRSAPESGRSGSRRSGRTRRWSPTGDPSGRNGARAPPRRRDGDAH